MKRFHVHLHVDDLAASIAFYQRLFAAEPSRREADYAKWMLDDPRINFAISTRGSRPGVDHLGFQVDSAGELAALKSRAESAEIALLDEGATSCCYARSEKHWITDPQGVAWEHFHTLADIPLFSEPAGPAATPKPGPSPDPIAATASAPAPACCAPRTTTGAADIAAPSATAATAATAAAAPAGRGRPVGVPVRPASSCC